jgi:polyhydroxyalkanoate synthesis regulator phasin
MKKAFTKLSLGHLLIFNTATTFAIDETDVSKMLDQFGQKGIISKEELMKAQQKLKKMSPEKWKQINAYTESQMNEKGRTPSSNNVDEAEAKINTDSKEFKKTMSDLEKIMIDK